MGGALPAVAAEAARVGPTLAAAVAGHARHRPSRTAWVDERGALSYVDLAREMDRLAPAVPAEVVVQCGDQRMLLVTLLAGLQAGAHVRVVGARSGTAALAAVRAGAPGCLVVTDDDPLPRGGDPAGSRADRRRGIGSVAFSTSGTTGVAKVVASAQGPAAATQALALLGAVPTRRRPVVASTATVDHGHGFGLLAGALGLGGTFVSLTDPERAVHTLTDPPGEVDLLSGVPRQLDDLAAAGLRRPRHHVIRAILSGSDRLEPDLEAALSRVAPVWNAYGATEIGTVCIASPADRRRSPGTVGHALTGVRIRVVDPLGAPLPHGEEGLLEITSPLRVGAAFVGDRGWIEPGGLVHVSGRADGRIVSGGETSDPLVLETWLRELPEVAGVEVRATPDARFGTRLVADLRLAAGRRVDSDDLRARIRAALGPALTPREVRIHR